MTVASSKEERGGNELVPFRPLPVRERSRKHSASAFSIPLLYCFMQNRIPFSSPQIVRTLPPPFSQSSGQVAVGNSFLGRSKRCPLCRGEEPLGHLRMRLMNSGLMTSLSGRSWPMKGTR
ncbi:hypothetical protein NPIL_547791 [Nephila pilipes]|uniref:Uncharacterized protein n=1 Tax=Nephila pilipes TaxID=299642 RepID=A0A8X6U2P4_NEPPI|nr:hypothetical protein NPIL_547791 [Nephila pilipes]